MGETLGALIAVSAFYVVVSEFFIRDVDMTFDQWRVKENSYASSPGDGRLREYRGPLYWTRWLIRQWCRLRLQHPD